MAICQIFVKRDLSEDQWEDIARHLRATGPVPPDGVRLTLAGPADPGWRVITVWDSEEARERFLADRLSRAYADAGLSLDSGELTVFDVHTLIAGDLTATPQPA